MKKEKPGETVWVCPTRSPIGRLTLASTSKGLLYLCFPGCEKGMERWLQRFAPGAKVVEGREANVQAENQLQEYFVGKRKVFDMALDLRGTPFQKTVYKALSGVPYGTTTSYGMIAKRIKRPESGRAVGSAMGRNPIPLVLPCHRVLGSNGSLVGFGGGLKMKQILLELESGTGVHRREDLNTIEK